MPAFEVGFAAAAPLRQEPLPAPPPPPPPEAVADGELPETEPAPVRAFERGFAAAPQPVSSEIRLPGIATVTFNTAPRGLLIRPGAPSRTAEAAIGARRRADPETMVEPVLAVSAPAPQPAVEPPAPMPVIAPEPRHDPVVVPPAAAPPRPEPPPEPVLPPPSPPRMAEREPPRPRRAERPAELHRDAPRTDLLGRGLAAFEDKDYLAAFRDWSAAAASGNRDAQYRLGLLYLRGQGVIRNVPDAAVWLRQAAERGHAEAQYELALIYQHGVEQPPGGVDLWHEIGGDAG